MPDHRQTGLQDGSSLPRTAPAVIVGGGIVGVATAWFLSRQGVDAVLIEAASNLGTRTTAMSAHCIRAQFGEPDNIRMMAESLAFYEQFSERCTVGNDRPEIGLTQQGYLFASTSAADRAGFETRIAQQAEAGLIDVELLDGRDVPERYPWLSDDIEVATFRQRDGWIDSTRAVAGMARSAGVSIHLGTRVDQILVQDGRVIGVRCPHGTIATDCVILAAGPFSRTVSPEPLPVRLWRRHRVIVGPRPEIPQGGPVTIDANTGAHWRPHLGGALAAWAQAEPDTDACWPVPTDEGFVDRILRGPDGIGRLAPFWQSLAPILEDEEITLTAGQYTMTPDHRPLIGPAVETSGLYLHTGYSGHGIMGAPGGARILAEEIAGVHPNNPFHPGRFSGQIAPPDVERVVI